MCSFKCVCLGCTAPMCSFKLVCLCALLACVPANLYGICALFQCVPFIGALIPCVPANWHAPIGPIKLILVFQVPPLLWQDQVKLLGLAVSFLICTMLNILALKVEEAGKVALVDKCSSIIVAFVSQVSHIPHLIRFVSRL